MKLECLIAATICAACATSPPPAVAPTPSYVVSVVLPPSDDGSTIELAPPFDLLFDPVDPPALVEASAELEDELEPEPRTAPEETLRVAHTLDLSDDVLAELWRTWPSALGPVAIGFADEGRLINAVPFPNDGGDTWAVVNPRTAWATSETIEAVIAAAKRVKSLHPTARPLRINDISARAGGPLDPHQSHQTGRDVDLGFYYPTGSFQRTASRETTMDVAQNWELLKSLLVTGDVQVVLLDRRVQRVLYTHARRSGEDPAWLQSVFFGPRALVKHANGHRDHFHVRYYNPRAQELGRRLARVVAEHPRPSLVTHRVQSGDTLAKIAKQYSSSVRAIVKANQIRGRSLSRDQVLEVPVLRQCTRCPVPPPLQLPPRRLPASSTG